MCTQKKEIRLFNGKTMFVKCGHCPACLQEKAFARATRIKGNADNNIMLFVTLTYQNSCVPYFDAFDLVHSPVYYTHIPTSVETAEMSVDEAISFGHLSGSYDYLSVSPDTDSGLKDSQPYQMCSVFRGCAVRRSPISGLLIRSFKRQNLGSFPIPYPDSINTNFKYLKGTHRARVGVCYYPDFQNFMKRLRINLSRNYEYSNLKLRSYYVCSEYGPTTCRPHFHAILFTENTPETLEQWKSAIAASWPFDYRHRCRKFVEIARNCASYVSSYVNCSSSVPPVLAGHRTFRPCHHYSQAFGTAIEPFTLPKVCEAFDKADLHYLSGHLKEGTYVVESLLLPKYVVHRYFPKFKGFGRLTPFEIQAVLLRPRELARFSYALDYSKDDLNKTITMLTHKVEYAASCGISRFDYARIYSGIWSLFQSQLLRDMYDSVDCLTDYFQLYDNIADLYSFSCRNYSLEDLILKYPDYDYKSDPNLFPNNIRDTLRMTFFYTKYSKQKKLNNELYSQIYKVF